MRPDLHYLGALTQNIILMSKVKYKYNFFLGDGWYYNGRRYSSQKDAEDAAANQLFEGTGVSTSKVSALRSWWNKITGSGLTNAEIQQNSENAYQADIDRQFQSDEARLAWERNEISAENAYARQREARQTQFQDLMSSAGAAGINPYFALGSGAAGVSSAPQGSASAPSGASAGAGLPNSGGLADLLNLLRIKSEINVNRSIAEKNKADANLADKNADLTEKQTDWYDVVTKSTVDKAKSEVAHNLETASSEHERRTLMLSESMLNNANAEQIAALMPYYQRELDARSAQERAAAKASLVSAAYEQGLIDRGMIEAAVRETNSRASVQEVEHSIQSFHDDVLHNRTTPLTEGDAFTGLGNMLIGAFSNPLGIIHASSSASTSVSDNVSHAHIYNHK